MEAKSTISLVAVTRPNSNPTLKRRSKFVASIEAQISKIDSHKAGRRTSKEAFWLGDDKAIYFALKYGKQNLELAKGKSTLKAATFDALVEQLEQIKNLAISGGLDDELAACANSVRANFKAAKDKKAGKG